MLGTILFIYLFSSTVDSYIWGIPGRFDQAVTLTFYFTQVCYGWPQKNSSQQFSHFFENFFGRNGQNRRDMKAVIDFFQIYIINFLIKEKFEIISSVGGEMVPRKMVPEKMVPRKMVPRKKGPRKNGSRGKKVSGKMVHKEMVPKEMVSGKMFSKNCSPSKEC